MSANILQKYDIPAPRYTSYPPIPQWRGAPSSNEWAQHLKQSWQKNSSVSFYIHIPYCRSLCHFCGCTKTISRDKSLAMPFVHTVHQEFKRYENIFPENLKVAEIHLGGGTPTWLDPNELESLCTPFLKKFSKEENFSFSIECDPRTTSLEHLYIFKKLGINRLSFGIQDFDPVVQTKINRIQSEEMVKQLVTKAREIIPNVEINFDLVYGLPGQNFESIAKTFKAVVAMNPSRLAFYSYAHVPQLKPAQKLVEKHGLPMGEEKKHLFNAGREILLQHGYLEIGMDHFALPTDSLAIAYNQGELHRNFMGYTVARSDVLVALGPSALSDSGLSYVQNDKDPNVWMRKIQNGENTWVSGHVINEEELIRKKMVMDLMCHFKTTMNLTLMNRDILGKILSFEHDGLVKFKFPDLEVTSQGKSWVRTIVMNLDQSSSVGSNHIYSQSV